ncbi:hypothetical protein [Bosea sp. (in: a-proteobacteria)]|uniref:hypothetical protein n=1 Tax=Bosea sp. (in: a-proteobacteria) TaxID=1871050 RepID=UPI002B49AC5A|nr:hypothetical protein [Bosea sp. (in: a-proteobacteria)]WRH60034.1 MAG: hypothetical protein RSE11_09785 [Bosea sp. (in: a-proteobacteria)]
MVSRLERLADQNRALHQQVCALIIAGQGTAIDTLPILGDLKELYQDCLSDRYDPRYDCHHQPLFRDEHVRELVDSLIAAQLDVLQGDVGMRASTAIIVAAEKAMGKHARPARERSRHSARRDIARTALCHAVITAMDATLNAIIATRLSKAKARHINRARHHGTP